jgi:ATP-binding protein involved in chromosome partitioning
MGATCETTARPDRRQQEKEEEQRRLQEQMRGVRRKLVVLSGKGGVGKSTVAANLAAALAHAGHPVGLLDVDIHGPSIPTLVGLDGMELQTESGQMVPVKIGERLSVMSIGFLLRSSTDAVIWRGPLKFSLIRQFLGDVAWGCLDYLVVDCPPGTGDEPLSVAQLVGRPADAVIVTTPQALAIADVRRCVTFCEKVELPVAGIIENMSGYVCPSCGAHADLFGRGGGEALASEMRVPFLGRIPIDPDVVTGGDHGTPFVAARAGSATAAAFLNIVRAIEDSSPVAEKAATGGAGRGQDG